MDRVVKFIYVFQDPETKKIILSDPISIDDILLNTKEGLTEAYCQNHQVAWYEFQIVNVLQCSGQKDINDKEIFEGCIITHPRQSRPYSAKAITKQVKCIVKWENGVFNNNDEDGPKTFNITPKFLAEPIDKTAKESKWGYDWSEFYYCEIIGNIFENPELLEVKNG